MLDYDPSERNLDTKGICIFLTYKKKGYPTESPCLKSSNWVLRTSSKWSKYYCQKGTFSLSWTVSPIFSFWPFLLSDLSSSSNVEFSWPTNSLNPGTNDLLLKVVTGDLNKQHLFKQLNFLLSCFNSVFHRVVSIHIISNSWKYVKTV